MTGYEGDLTPQEAWDFLAATPNAVLVDVRMPGEWQAVGIPDLAELGRDVALNTLQTPAGPNPSFLDDLRAAGLEPGDDRPVVFLCKSGGRSPAAARIATAAGFGPAYNVLEGYEGHAEAGWFEAGLPAKRWEA